MVGEHLQNYVNLVNGLSRATRARAIAAARALLAQAGLEDAANDAGEKVTKLTEELLNASRANRELLENLVTAEVEKATAHLGLVRTEDLELVNREIARLQRDVIELRAALALATEATAATTPTTPRARPRSRRPRVVAETGPGMAPVPTPPVPAPPVPTPPAGSAETTDVGASAATASVTASPISTGTPAVATKSPAKKAAAKKSPAKKTAAKRTAAKKTAETSGVTRTATAPTRTPRSAGPTAGAPVAEPLAGVPVSAPSAGVPVSEPAAGVPGSTSSPVPTPPTVTGANLPVTEA